LALRNRCFRTRSNALLPRGFLDSDEQSEFEAALTAILLRAVLRFLFAFKVFYSHLSQFIK
ncbi:hypothetical protein T03_2641, partial [Trichinella britovi]